MASSRTIVEIRRYIRRFSTIVGHWAMVASQTSRMARRLCRDASGAVTNRPAQAGTLALGAAVGPRRVYRTAGPTDAARASARRPARRRPRAEGESVSLRIGRRRTPDDLAPARQDDPLGRLQMRRGAVDPGAVERGSRQLR